MSGNYKSRFKRYKRNLRWKNNMRKQGMSDSLIQARLAAMAKDAGDLIEGPWHGTGVPPHVKVYEPDHEYPGEINEHHYEIDRHDEYESAAEQAARVLADHGLTEPSTAPGFHPNLWYSHPDEGGDYSGHLNGLNPQEQQTVWAILQSQNDVRNHAPDAPPPGHPADWA